MTVPAESTSSEANQAEAFKSIFEGFEFAKPKARITEVTRTGAVVIKFSKPMLTTAFAADHVLLDYFSQNDTIAVDVVDEEDYD